MGWYIAAAAFLGGAAGKNLMLWPEIQHFDTFQHCDQVFHNPTHLEIATCQLIFKDWAPAACSIVQDHERDKLTDR